MEYHTIGSKKIVFKHPKSIHMRKGVFILFLTFFLCLHILPCSLSETNFTNKADDHYKQLKQGSPQKDLQGSDQMNVGAAVVGVMRARGAYSGGSDIRHGHSKNDANPLQIKSTSSFLWKLSCGLFSFCLLLAGF